MTTATKPSRIEERLAAMQQDPSKPYFIRYRLDIGRFDPSDAKEDEGLTQDLILISCITQPDGGYSQLWHGINGATGNPMHSLDVFKAWILMAASLRDKEDLPPAERSFVKTVFETWRKVMLAA